MRVLCLDIEGGYGGSSRSLYESLRYLPQSMAAEVWCRKSGPTQERLASINIDSRITPDMPHVSSLPLLSRNIYAYTKFALGWKGSAAFRKATARSLRERFDLIHFNHEGLFLLARWLRRELGRQVAMTAHVRTRLPVNVFTRWQYRTLDDAVDGIVFISEMEKERVNEQIGKESSGPVIYNIVSELEGIQTDTALAVDDRFKIASTSNFAYIRGTDRLIDVAVELKNMGVGDRFLIVVAGHFKLLGRMPGLLGDIAQRGGTLADYADAMEVGHMFKFLGHVPDTAPYLSACQALLRPSRGNDPWGREVLEAMSLGLPVLATGVYDRFVEDGATGFLQPKFNAREIATVLVHLLNDSEQHTALRQAAQSRVRKLCNGPDRAAELHNFWTSIVKSKTNRQ